MLEVFLDHHPVHVADFHKGFVVRLGAVEN